MPSYNSTDFDPPDPGPNPVDLIGLPSIPILPTPWVQMGWGYVGNDTWKTIVATLQGNPPPPKPPEAVAYMAQQQAAREAYWSNRP